jgi:DNA repair protein RadC
MRYQRAEPPLKLDGLAAARSFFSGCLSDADPETEQLFVAHTDEQTRCLHVSRHEGDPAGTAFPLRAIIAEALEHGSAGIVLAHNHPSGDARPSKQDLRMTRRLALAAEAINCAVLDHLVFGGSDCSSLRRLGYL